MRHAQITPARVGSWILAILAIPAIFATFPDDNQRKMVAAGLAFLACSLVVVAWESYQRGWVAGLVSVFVAVLGGTILVGATMVAWSRGGADPALATVPLRSAAELPSQEGADGQEAMIAKDSSEDFFIDSSPVSVSFDGLTSSDRASLRAYTRAGGTCEGEKKTLEGLLLVVPTSDSEDTRVSLRLSVRKMSADKILVRVERLHDYVPTGGDGFCGQYPLN